MDNYTDEAKQLPQYVYKKVGNSSLGEKARCMLASTKEALAGK